MASSYHNLGILAQERGDYAEAERRYLQAFEINDRLGNQTNVAAGHHNLGVLTQGRGEYEEAERRYLQSMEINKRLGNQVVMATSSSQLGILGSDRGAVEDAIGWHLRALGIRLRLEIPQVRIDLSHLRRHRETLGVHGCSRDTCNTGNGS